jgi:flagellar biogenesis protein FliO
MTANAIATANAFVTDIFARLRSTVLTRRSKPALVLKETLGLGEKRFVAIIECDGRRMLVGGGGQSVALIAHLDTPPQEHD